MTPAPGCRFGDRCALETYESALVCLGEHSEMTRAEIVAGVARQYPGKSETYLRACLSPYDQSHNLQLAVAPFFTVVSGNPALLAWHARMAGYGLHKLPTATSGRGEALLALRDVLEAQQQVTRAVITGAADRRFTVDERAEVTLRGKQAIAELVELIAAVNLEAEPTRCGVGEKNAL